MRGGGFAGKEREAVWFLWPCPSVTDSRQNLHNIPLAWRGQQSEFTVEFCMTPETAAVLCSQKECQAHGPWGSAPCSREGVGGAASPRRPCWVSPKLRDFLAAVRKAGSPGLRSEPFPCLLVWKGWIVPSSCFCCRLP